MFSKTVVVVPTLNAGRLAAQFADALLAQSVAAHRIIVIDSESDDESRRIFEAAGFEVFGVPRSSFDHGATRNLALTLAPEAEFVVYLTQDAILCGSESLRLLLAPFADSSVGVVYGRQLPRPQAGAIERHARLFNYPALAMKRTLSSVSGAGIKAVFNSNSFAAYRRKALDGIGGFPDRVIFGEDQIAAGRMLVAGWTICYEARAEVIHSHGYSLLAEFRRYFDHGVAHARNQWLLERFGAASAEGLRFVLSELRYLFRAAPARIPEACIRTFLKYAGYRLGRNESRLPLWLRVRLSRQKSFFSAARKSAGTPDQVINQARSR